MLKVKGEVREEEWHGGWHGAWHGHGLVFSSL
jgi:hypothetical protein